MNSKRQLPMSPLLREKSVKSGALLAPAPGAGICLLNQPSKSLTDEPKYGIKEACGKMGVGETTLRSIIKTGGIAVLNIGGKHLLLERDVEQYLQGNYGTIREAKVEPNRLAPLPESVAKSEHLRKAV